ncbi:MAG: hypothetical protein M1826_005307 [Phylliscum demangeonii]|nr:MAG: hypothetical protein M1826_005307 [Phylliscum demangeonii]
MSNHTRATCPNCGHEEIKRCEQATQPRNNSGRATRPVTWQPPRASLLRGECASCGYRRRPTPPWKEPYPPCSPFLTLAELDDCYERRYEAARQHYSRVWELWVFTQHGPYGETTHMLSETARTEYLQVLRLWEENQRLFEVYQLHHRQHEDAVLVVRSAVEEGEA